MTHPRPAFGPPAHAELALLLEVSGTPKPGNVDRDRDHPDLRFDQFLAGAVGARPGLDAAADGDGIGRSFERAVAGMRQQESGNTQLGALFLLVPLVRTAATGELTSDRARETVAATTVDDARHFFAAFDHVDVTFPDPPADLDALDVRRGSTAGVVAAERGLTLHDVVSLATDDPGAREWTTGFPRTFGASRTILDDDGPPLDRVARAYLDLLGQAEDTLVRTEHGTAVAREVRERAATCSDLDDAERLAAEFRDRGINPGATADVAAAAAFVALERGLPI